MSTTAHDDFEAELRALLQSVTSTLGPRLDLDDVGSMALRVPDAPSRTWARAGAIGLTAAACVGAIVWIGDEPHDTLVPSTSAPRVDDLVPSPSAIPSLPASDATTPVAETLPVAAFAPINVLVVGVDRRVDCIPPDSPSAGAFPVDDLGSRADAIMILRLDPTTGTVSVLSFPRDLWVTIAGRASKGRINSAMTDADPTRLIATLDDNFGLTVDHFVQLDYCGVRTLVDGLGGVDVPFAAPARDLSTGLLVDGPGCVRLDGLAALAYLRSRKFETLGDDGTWQHDAVADLGRISRQQDFLLRLVEEWSQAGMFDVEATRSMLSAVRDDLVVDTGLTLDRMLEIAGFVSTVGREDVRSFGIEATGANVAGQSVLLPRLEGDNMRAVLALFRGETVFGPTGVDSPTSLEEPAASASESAEVVPEENPKGIVPPSDVTC